MALLCRPYDFQIAGIKQIERWGGRGLLSDQMGLGKSVSALLLMDRNPWFPVVVICEASLKLLWQREFKKHAGIDAVVLKGTVPDVRKVRGKDAVIINPDILYAWVWTLQSIKPGLVVADEVQWAKNPEAGRTWALRELVKTVPHFLPMSGTPIMNRPIEFWSVLNMLDPERWFSHHVFGHRYCKPRRNVWDQSWEFKGCTNAAELHAILTDPKSGYMVRRLKSEVLKELPAKTYTTVPLKLKRTEYKEYNAAKSDIRSWLLTNYGNSKTNGAIKAQALNKVNVLRELTLKLKLPHVLEWVESFLDSDEKLILFGQHRKFVRETHERFANKSVMVYGGISDTQRLEAFDAFNDDPSVPLFVGNSAAAAGWSATACSNVALGEFPWQPAQVDQMVSRAHGLFRGVAGMPTNAYFLVADETIDVDMLESLRTKEDYVSSVLDGVDWRERQDSVFEDVVRKLMEGK